MVTGQLSATVEWTAASGPVAGYRVFVARNDTPPALYAVVTETRVVLQGIQQYGDELQVTVAAFDVTGAQGPTSEASEIIVFETSDGANLPPAVTPVGNRRLEVGEQMRIPVSATDPNGDPIGLSIGGLPPFARFFDRGNGTGEIVVEPGENDAGHFLITISARDVGDPPALQLEAFELVIDGPNRAPTFRTTAPFEVAEGGAGFLFLRASDPDGDAISIDPVDLPGFASLYDQGGGAALVRVEPGFDDAGTYTWSVRAFDDGEPALGTVHEIAVTILDLNRPPEWTSEASFQAAAGEVAQSLVTAEDGDGDELAIELAGGPAFASTVDHGDGSATLTLAPEIEAQGRYVLQLRATDDGTPSHSVVQTARVSVIGAPELHVWPETLVFDVSYGEKAPTAYLMLSNSGGGDLDYVIDPSTPRFALESEGRLSGAEVTVVEIAFDVANVPIGSFPARIEIGHDGLGAPLHVVDVWLNMRDPKAKTPTRRVLAPSLRAHAVRDDARDPKPAEALFAAQQTTSDRVLVVRQWSPGRPAEVLEILHPGGVQTLLSEGDLLDPLAWGGPTAIAQADDGTVYVTVVDGLGGDEPTSGEAATHAEVSARVVGIDPVTGVQRTVSSDGLLLSPQGVAVQPDGTLRVADLSSGLLRIDPETGAQSIVAVLAGASGLQTLDDGDLLVTLDYGPDVPPSVIRIEPDSGEMMEAGVTLPPDQTAGGAAAP